MRCCRSDWPGLCLFCCYQPSCVVSQQSWFWAFLFHKYSNFTPLPHPQVSSFRSTSWNRSISCWSLQNWTLFASHFLLKRWAVCAPPPLFVTSIHTILFAKGFHFGPKQKAQKKFIRMASRISGRGPLLLMQTMKLDDWSINTKIVLKALLYLSPPMRFCRYWQVWVQSIVSWVQATNTQNISLYPGSPWSRRQTH